MSRLTPPDDLDHTISSMGPVATAAFEDARTLSLLLRELVQWRKSHGMTQQAVAVAMDTTQSAVSELESGRAEPRLSTLQRYVRAVGRQLHVVLNPGEDDSDSSAAWKTLAEDVLPTVIDESLGRVLKALLRNQTAHGARSASQLVEQTGLPESAVGKSFRSLSANGWIRIVGDPGQSTPLAALVPDRARVVGVSVYEDNALGIITDLRAETPLDVRQCTLPSTTPRAAVAAVAELVSDLIEAGGDGREVIGLGVELAGVIQDDLGVVSFAPDLERRNQLWHDLPLEAELHAATGLRAVVENDTNALAVHEYLRRGDTSDLAVVLLSENGGIGCGLVHEGKLLHGTCGISGEIGHIVVDPQGEPCNHVDHRGCLETTASATAIATRVMQAEARGESTLDVYRAAGQSLGGVLATLTSILALPLIVVYGPPALTEVKMRSARVFGDAIKDSLDQGWFTQFGMKPNLETRILDPIAGARGAASVAISNFLHRPLHWMSAMQGVPDVHGSATPAMKSM